MSPARFCFIFCLILTNGRLVQSQVIPTFYTAFLVDTARANGSSPTGHCLSFDITSPNTYCHAPATSVLFDRTIPTLTGLGGDTWASDLLTLKTEASINLFESYVSVLYLFHNQPDYTGVERMELVLFNCPEWGIEVGSIEVNEFNTENTTTVAIQSFRTTSCDSLVRVCVPFSTTSTNLQVKFLSVPAHDFYVHLAEVTFYADSSTCPPEAVISADPVTTHGSPDPTTSPSSSSSHAHCPTQSGGCPSCVTSNSWASVSTAIGTALLTTAIFVLVQIALCKCRPKFTPGGAAKMKVPTEGLDPIYERISEDEMEVGPNESYTVDEHFSASADQQNTSVGPNESLSRSTLAPVQNTSVGPNESYTVDEHFSASTDQQNTSTDQQTTSTIEPFYDYMVCDD